MSFKVNPQAIGPILQQLQKALMRHGIQPTWKLGDAALLLAATMHEKGGKATFLERATAWWDEMEAAGEPDAATKRDYAAAVLDAALPPPNEVTASHAHDVADLVTKALRPGEAFVLQLADASGQIACIANRAEKIKIVECWLAYVKAVN